MNDRLTEFIVILDSNTEKESDVRIIDHVKKYREHLNKKGKHDVRLTIVEFSAEEKMHLENKPVEKIRKRTFPMKNTGATATYDAIGKTIDNVGKRYANTPEGEIPASIYVVIIAFDGDNASKTFTYKDVHEKIQHQSEVYKWKFIMITDKTTIVENLGIKNYKIVSPEDGEEFIETGLNWIDEQVYYVHEQENSEQ